MKNSNSVFSMLPRRGALSAFELILFGLFILMIASNLSSTLQDVLVLTFLWAGLALAWNIAGGYVGLISFGHAAFFAVGAYTSTILLLKFGISPWYGMLAGGLLAAIISILLSLVSVRLRGPFFILATLALSESVRIIILNWTPVTGGAQGLSIPFSLGPGEMVFKSTTSYLVIAFAFMTIMYVLSRFIEEGRFRYILTAIKDNDNAASSLGINIIRAKTLTMAVSAFLTAIGGTLFAQYFLYFDPSNVASLGTSFQFALIPAVGGIGTAIGPILGSLIITPLSELLRTYMSDSLAGLHMMIYGFFVIVIMLYFPSGLAGIFEYISNRKDRRQK